MILVFRREHGWSRFVDFVNVAVELVDLDVLLDVELVDLDILFDVLILWLDCESKCKFGDKEARVAKSLGLAKIHSTSKKTKMLIQKF